MEVSIFVSIKANNRVITELHHQNEKPTIVDDFQEESSFVQNIIYDANLNQIEALINRSSSCWQYVRYDCFRSKLLNSPYTYNFKLVWLIL